MNPILLHLANGNAFFIGMGLVALAAAAGCFRQQRRVLKALLASIWVIGIVLVVISATPLPFWIYGVWLGFCLTGLIVFNRRTASEMTLRSKVPLMVAILVLSLTMCLMEMPFHRPPSIEVSGKQTVIVVGDSISAGTVASDRSWPLILGDLTHLKVINLAQPGATVASARTQAARISGREALILVEIGGNDLLGGSDAHQFHHDLDKLLATLADGKNQVVMFELPGVPFQNGFGITQRLLARQHKVALIPKSFMTRVFSLESNTVDGLHLSQAGHDALAKSVSQLLQQAERPLQR